MTRLTLKTPLSAETKEKLQKMKEPPAPQPASPKPAASKGNPKPIAPKDPKKAAAKPPKQPAPKKEAKEKGPSLTAEEMAKISREKFETAKTWLEATFPEIINFNAPKPFKLRIDREIMAHVPSKSQVRKALNAYVKSEAYLKATLEDGWRYGLGGEKVEEVLEKHKEYAKKKLLKAGQQELRE